MHISQLAATRKQPLLATLLDIRKAYDSVPHEVLAHALLRKQCIPTFLSRFILGWVRDNRRVLLLPGNREELTVARGTPQGSILAPFMFTCVMDTLRARLAGEATLGLPACAG